MPPIDEQEGWLNLCFAMRGLVNSEHLDPEVRLRAVDEAITRAVGGTVRDALEYCDQVTLGLIE